MSELVVAGAEVPPVVVPVPIDVLAVMYSSVVEVSLMSVVPLRLSPNSLEDCECGWDGPGLRRCKYPIRGRPFVVPASVVSMLFLK